MARTRRMTEGNVFSLSITRGVTPSPSHNTSTHWGGPQSLVQFPFPKGVPQSQAGGYPISAWWVYLRTGLPPSRTGLGYPPCPGLGCPPPHPPSGRLCLDRLRCGRYASCGFPQEDCPSNNDQINVHSSLYFGLFNFFEGWLNGQGYFTVQLMSRTNCIFTIFAMVVTSLWRNTLSFFLIKKKKKKNLQNIRTINSINKIVRIFILCQ